MKTCIICEKENLRKRSIYCSEYCRKFKSRKDGILHVVNIEDNRVLHKFRYHGKGHRRKLMDRFIGMGTEVCFIVKPKYT